MATPARRGDWLRTFRDRSRRGRHAYRAARPHTETFAPILISFPRNRGLHRASREATSNQLDDPPLRVGMRFDVALGGRKR